MTPLAPAGVRYADLLLYLLYTVASVTGLILVKSHMPGAKGLLTSGMVARWDVALVVVGAGLYVASFLLWLLILGRNELSLAYPIAIGLTLVFSTLAARIMLGETLSSTRLCGVGVVFCGIWLITRA